MAQPAVSLVETSAAFIQSNLTAQVAVDSDVCDNTTRRETYLELSGSSTVYAEGSLFSGSMSRSDWAYPGGLRKSSYPDSRKSYVLHKDCRFTPTLNVSWAQSFSEVYVACYFSALVDLGE